MNNDHDRPMKKLDPAIFRRVDKEELLQRVRNGVCQFMNLSANLEMDHEYPPAEPDDRNPAVTAMIAFDGDCLGLVWAQCSESLAVRMATGMLGTRPAGVNDDVRDVLGAMINILGGDVKLLLSRSGCKVGLSLPWVSDAAHSSHPDFSNDHESMRCSFLYGEERLLVGLTVKKALEELPA